MIYTFAGSSEMSCVISWLHDGCSGRSLQDYGLTSTWVMWKECLDRILAGLYHLLCHGFIVLHHAQNRWMHVSFLREDQFIDCISINRDGHSVSWSWSISLLFIIADMCCYSNQEFLSLPCVAILDWII